MFHIPPKMNSNNCLNTTFFHNSIQSAPLYLIVTYFYIQSSFSVILYVFFRIHA